jgi:hypothetical protein
MYTQKFGSNGTHDVVPIFGRRDDLIGAFGEITEGALRDSG